MRIASVPSTSGTQIKSVTAWVNLFGYLYAAHARGRAAAVALPRTSLSLPGTFTGLLHNQFEIAAQDTTVCALTSPA
jgi:hypothetical protein